VHVVHIPKNHLMLIAGLVWCAAGAMVCMIGLPMEFGLAPSHLILFPLAVVIFLVFYFLVFSRLVAKAHWSNPRAGGGSAPLLALLQRLVLGGNGVMMGGGLALRLSHLMPDWMIAFFYTGSAWRSFSAAFASWHLRAQGMCWPSRWSGSPPTPDSTPPQAALVEARLDSARTVKQARATFAH